MLGARIAALRRAKGWSQGELAQRLQISPSAVGMYEQERREPGAALLVSMARLLDVSVDYLLTGQALPQEQERTALGLERVLSDTDAQLQHRSKRPLSRQELAVLFAALLMEP